MVGEGRALLGQILLQQRHIGHRIQYRILVIREYENNIFRSLSMGQAGFNISEYYLGILFKHCSVSRRC